MRIPVIKSHRLVYPTSIMTKDLAREALRLGHSFLDMGCGEGYITVFLALNGKCCDATDYLKSAIKCTTDNIERNKCGNKARVLHESYLFDKIPRRKYDCIIFNMPMKFGKGFFSKSKHSIGYFFMNLGVHKLGKFTRSKYNDPSANPSYMDVLENFIKDAKSYLHRGGSILLIIKEGYYKALGKKGYKIRVLRNFPKEHAKIVKIYFVDW